ncbi:MAG: hypothetical protein EOO65_05480 [Methanosarcinales archaeon]|nr:MAG: hypothetical protein EOO65_05480 [Methanosarcinales archaeon]
MAALRSHRERLIAWPRSLRCVCFVFAVLNALCCGAGSTLAVVLTVAVRIVIFVLLVRQQLVTSLLHM